MPATAKGGRYPPSVQFIRKLTLGNEASRHKLPDDRAKGLGSRICGPLLCLSIVDPAALGGHDPAPGLRFIVNQEGA
jgi:hypothetical protein